MVHEQFEATHPFVGGNGRLGRLLITLFLIDRGRLTHPLLYLSAYFEGHRDEYYTLLQRVRTRGEWTPWLLFFLEGVRQTAERATTQARALIRHHERSRSLVSGHALALADETFRTPCITAPHARRALALSKPAARSAIGELVAKGLLEEWGEKHRPRVYLARPVLDAVLHPLEELRRPLEGVEAGARSSLLLVSSSRRQGAPTVSWRRPWPSSTRRAAREPSCVSPAGLRCAATASTSGS